MKKLLIGGVAAAVLAIAPAALAHSPSGSSEERTFSCASPDATYPPQAGQCPANPTTETYTVHTNDVQCADGELASTEPSGVIDTNVYGDQEGQGGYLEVCSEAGPVQGRVILQGTFSDGIDVTADGDKDNGDNPANGWITVHGDDGGPSYRCGDEAGSKDSTHTTDADTDADCG